MLKAYLNGLVCPAQAIVAAALGARLAGPGLGRPGLLKNDERAQPKDGGEVCVRVYACEHAVERGATRARVVQYIQLGAHVEQQPASLACKRASKNAGQRDRAAEHTRE